MKSALLYVVVYLLFMGCCVAMGDTYSFVPPDPDLGDLDHTMYYTWGMDRPWELEHDGVYENAAGATLSFNDIWNWDNGPNNLYIHLLNDGPLGITTGWDGEDHVDAFAGQGVLLEVYVNLPSTPQDLTYTFSDAEVIALNSYAADGRFALAFDPDCHYYNCGVELKVRTEMTQIPEPGAMVLLSAGTVVGVLRYRRRYARSH